jgi:hypothetical protein
MTHKLLELLAELSLVIQDINNELDQIDENLQKISEN